MILYDFEIPKAAVTEMSLFGERATWDAVDETIELNPRRAPAESSTSTIAG